jgi:hypothetical protein
MLIGRRKMRRKQKPSGSTDQKGQSGLAEALKRLIRILARQAAREAIPSTQPPITEHTDG